MGSGSGLFLRRILRVFAIVAGLLAARKRMNSLFGANDDPRERADPSAERAVHDPLGDPMATKV